MSKDRKNSNMSDTDSKTPTTNMSNLVEKVIKDVNLWQELYTKHSAYNVYHKHPKYSYKENDNIENSEDNPKIQLSK